MINEPRVVVTGLRRRSIEPGTEPCYLRVTTDAIQEKLISNGVKRKANMVLYAPSAKVIRKTTVSAPKFVAISLTREDVDLMRRRAS